MLSLQSRNPPKLVHIHRDGLAVGEGGAATTVHPIWEAGCHAWYELIVATRGIDVVPIVGLPGDGKRGRGHGHSERSPLEPGEELRVGEVEGRGFAEEGEFLAATKKARDDERIKGLMTRPVGGQGG